MLLGGRLFSSYVSSDSDAVPCINPLRPIPAEYHIHPRLTLRILGEERKVPANIGITLGECERVLHTHDDTGELHIEPNGPIELTLGDFFELWGESFSRERLLDRATDETHEIVLTVNGEPSDAYGTLILRDMQEIVIEYREKPKNGE